MTRFVPVSGAQEELQEAGAGQWGGGDTRCHRTQHAQQRASTAPSRLLRVPAPAASAAAPAPSEYMPFSADICHPLHQPGAVGMPGGTPGLPIPADTPPFRFQPRRLAVDWRRFSAIDVERVAREVDLAALQDHVAGVTFCNLDGERCPHCGQPADPILLKVLRMAQLSIEYLLHCQERLGTSLALHARRLEAAHAELACTRQRAEEQAVRLRGAEEESRRWKKLVAAQQVFLPTCPFAYHKCHLCDKAFMDDSFLQAHVRRRHTDATEEERQKTRQVKQMEDEVEALKVKVREAQRQLEAEKTRREQETERARQQEEEGRRDLERWKEEERTKLHEEIDSLRQLFLTAFKDVASRSSAMEGRLQELQAREVVVSNLGTLRDSDTEETRMAVQIKLLSARKPEVTQEVTKVVAVEELSGGEEATRGRKQRLLEALRRNPNLLKQFRPILEEVLEEKLESMGVKKVAKGISTRTYKSLQALVRLQQQQKSEKFPGLLHLRDELGRAVMRKVRRCKKPSSALPRQLSIIPAQSLKSSRSLGGSRPMVTPAAVEPEALVVRQPAPRSRTHSTHSPPRTPRGALRTSKASSPHRGLVPQWSPEAAPAGKKPTLSPVKLSPQREPAFSAAVQGDETDSDGSDQDSLEETAGSGTATSTTVRFLERRLDAVAQTPPRRVKRFPALSSPWPKTSQPAKKLQFAGDSSDLQTSSLEDLAEPPAAAAAADAPRDHHGPQGPGAARGRVVVTGK
ncbi:cilium assembly protein DZIP1L-like [Rissa tridactyla]|uniref:cilium assembly protein DZIP1L-like n=1 Tax=Rissa tridactyla TaxID=75485 RepID=UPI0023BA65AA|nr:cilium assembly protein DZIP1L-like [Rissa tridactyla]